MYETLTEDNFEMYAIKNYSNPHCDSREDFEKDLSRLNSVKRLLMKYARDGELKERLILNHLIILYNLFGNAATRMLLFKLPEELLPSLKTFLLFINRLPEQPVKHMESLYECSVDMIIAKRLREI